MTREEYAEQTSTHGEWPCDLPPVLRDDGSSIASRECRQRRGAGRTPGHPVVAPIAAALTEPPGSGGGVIEVEDGGAACLEGRQRRLADGNVKHLARCTAVGKGDGHTERPRCHRAVMRPYLGHAG